MINDASVVIGGGNWGIKEADVLGYKLINDEYYARDIDFANSTAAGTYTDSTGVIRKAPYNLVQYSEMFSDASWAKTTTTVEINTISSPVGTLTGDTLVASGSFPRIVQNPTIQANQSYRISVYAKAGTASVFTISVTVNSVALVNNVQYNLSNGVVTGAGTMQSVGDGWYLCSATFTVGASTASPDIRFYNHAQGITGGWSGTNFFYAWGAQLVEGTEALPYFPTTTRLNVPRIDYRNADGSLSTTGRLLLEPQRTNSLFYSEQFDNAYFAKGNSSILANAAISPSGNQDADKLVPDTSNSIHSVNKSSQSIVGGIYSVFAKADGYDWILLTSHSSSSPPTRGAFFNVNNGTVGTTGAGVNAKIQNYGNGWYRCSISEGNSPSSIWTVIATNADNVITFTGNGTDGVLIWGGQNEQGTYPTTYIPTTTAAVTRNSDSASRTGVSSWIGQEQGTLFFECNLKTFSSISALFTLSDGTSTNRLRGRRTAAQTISFERNLSGQTDQSVFLTTVPASGTIKAAFAWSTAANGMAIYINGTGTSLAAAIPMFSGQLSVVSLGMLQDATSQLGDGIGQVYLLPTRITNEQLQSLTTL